jgi:hypothetical protein
MDSAADVLFQASQGVSVLLGFGGNLALVVVVATVVRRHRPDAHGPLLLWAIAGLVFGVFMPAVGFAAPAFSASGGFESVLTTQAVIIFAGAVLHLVVVLLLVRGLVKLAQPPKAIVAPPDGPYR